MDAPKPPPIVTQSLKRKDRSPSPARRTPSHTSSTAGSRPSPTSLPSIRHFLPQPDVQQLNERYHSSRQPRQPQPPGPAFSAGPSAGIPRLEFLPPPAHASVERTHSGIIADSDGDGDSEQATRPKQKRRRQALSCTECKRRKIKCDRAHPCTPCIRRGDQNKCQWHVIEPVDKYVSRAEYDELKIRVDRLEAMLSCAQPSTGLAAPLCSETSPHQQHQHQQQQSTRPLGAATSAAGHRAQGPGPAPQVPYHPLSPPIIPGQTPAGLAGPSRAVGSGGIAQDYGSPLALRGPNSPPGRTALPPLASLANGPVPFDGPPPPGPMPPRSLHRERDRDRDRDRDHASDHQQQQRHGESVHQSYAPPPPQLQQPLQPPHQQTKNSHAQTLTPLGERLRLCTTLQGPAAAVLRLRHHPNIFCSSRPRNSSSSQRRRLRLLARTVQVHCTATAIIPACRQPRLHFLGRQRSGVQSVTSEGDSAIPTDATSTSPIGTLSRGERGRALCR
ncbi:hypothetical protein EDB89DRAFT_647481 [Lactarius sanguifluus]|nr:hypothetical protein EDB89DRAFT_647481 [Lactarius sanguifluus]